MFVKITEVGVDPEEIKELSKILKIMQFIAGIMASGEGEGESRKGKTDE